MSFVIEKGIPMPEKQTKWKQVFSEIEVGDSFIIDNQAAKSVSTAAWSYGFKVSVRKIDKDNLRVWITGRVDKH